MGLSYIYNLSMFIFFNNFILCLLFVEYKANVYALLVNNVANACVVVTHDTVTTFSDSSFGG